jgi:hypothetical protein
MAAKKKITVTTKSTVPQKTKLDKKRQKIKDLLEKEEIRSFADIFEVYMPETPFAQMIGLQKKQLDSKLADLEKFDFKDITRISIAFEVDFDKIVRFIANLVKAQHTETAGKIKSK